ncbi:glucan biosynthesis protein [Ketogulonicigenium robustum]|uniref:glucan biosynthesis protein n=1 Tax=Ketogulonicigenium robustum TaxID=92947 RepID=UPI001F367B22|nr:glucan biosynthesis protein D [Ketogulonicigenium robustum]
MTTPTPDAAEPFSFDILKEMARTLAASPYVPQDIPDADVLEEVDYDEHNQISFRPEDTLFQDQGNASPVQMFFPGKFFKSPVRIFTLQDGLAHEVNFALDMFDIPSGNPAEGLTNTHGFAGFRVMDAETKLDWMAFLGASYWRTSGYSGQFGLSVRGLALDTAINGPEEFPLFTRFWLEPAENGDLTAYALMESPRATGAYRIQSHRDNGVIQQVSASVYLRGDVERLGIAPLTSMFWYGKNSRFLAADWRPEIHDSDGLQILTGSGEQIWRPLNNPPHTMVNTFQAPNVQGFGLMQRERDFVQYQDDGVFYEKRASVWVAPEGDWGDGNVSLVELRTDDEIHDNIVAFWQPNGPAAAGNSYDFAYKLTWLEDSPATTDAARFIATRVGVGGNPGQVRPEDTVKVVCDFDGHTLTGFGRGDGVTVIASASGAVVGNESVYPVVGQDYWRAMFDIDFSAVAEGDDTPIDVRMYVAREGSAETETLLLQFFPSQLRKLLAAAA